MRLTILLSALLLSVGSFAQNYYLFIGTYTGKNESKGIYVYKFNASTGEATPVSTIMTDNPSYLAVASGGHFLYAANEAGGTNGGVSAFSFDKKTGQLQFLNKQAGGGNGPCYVSVDSHRKWVLLANYGGGSASALPIGTDGSVGPLAQLIQHTGQVASPERQGKPHVHTVVFTPDERYLLTCDLGLDKVSIYKFNPNARQPLQPTADSLKTEPVSGPRHLAWHPSKPYLYLIEEIGGYVDAMKYSKGRLTLIQRINAQTEGFTGRIGSGDIHTSPDGRFVYASNRDDGNNIAIFAVDQATGKLTIKGFQPVLGKVPRNFVIDPTGHYLLAANQTTNNIVIFKIDQATGLLEPTGKQLEIPSPVCLKMTAADDK